MQVISRGKLTACRGSVVLVFHLLLVAAAASADDTAGEEPISYYRQIRPIFQAHCQGCHQPAKRSGEYVMTEFDGMVGGGETGMAAIVPGNPDESYLVQQITPVDGTAEMPKDKPPLAEDLVALIRKWIEQGAKDDTPASAKPRYSADNPPVYTAPPVITALRFSPNGELLAASGYHEVLLLEAAAAREGKAVLKARLVGMSERVEAVAFSSDGMRLAVAGGSPARFGELQIWNLEDFSLEMAIPVGYDTCYGVSWSADNKLVAVGCPDNSLRAYAVESGEQVFFNGAHNDWVTDTVFSKEQSHLVSVSRDRSMKLYEVSAQRFIDNITSITPGALKGGLHALDRHPERDELLIGGADGVPKIYRMFREQDRKIGDDYNLIRALPQMGGRVFDVSYSTDGRLAIAGSSDDGAGHVFVYSVEDGKLVSKAQGIESPIFSVALTGDAKQFAAGGLDGYVYVGSVESGEQIGRFLPVPLAAPGVAASSASP